LTAFLGELVVPPFPDDADPALRAARENPLLMEGSMFAAWDAWLTSQVRRAS